VRRETHDRIIPPSIEDHHRVARSAIPFQILLREFPGEELAFDDIREQTWKLPFVEKHYREVIQKLRAEGIVTVTPVSSKRSGLRERDLVRFPENSGSGGSTDERQP